MATIGNLVIDLRARTAQFEQDMTKAQRVTATVSTRMSSQMKALGGAIVAAFSVKAISSFTSEASRLYEVQEAAERRLIAAMKEHGQYSEANIAHSKEFASALQELSVIGDEAILGLQRTFINFGITAGGSMDSVTQATLDFAAGIEMGLKGAGDLIAKTWASPTNALSRYGLVVEGAAGSQERLASIIEAVDAKFRGSALAEADNQAGKIQQMSNAVGDLKETFGELFSPNVIAGALTLKEWAESMNNFLRGKFIDPEPFKETISMMEDRLADLKKQRKRMMGVREDSPQLQSLLAEIDDVKAGLMEIEILQQNIQDGGGEMEATKPPAASTMSQADIDAAVEAAQEIEDINIAHLEKMFELQIEHDLKLEAQREAELEAAITQAEEIEDINIKHLEKMEELEDEYYANQDRIARQSTASQIALEQTKWTALSQMATAGGAAILGAMGANNKIIFATQKAFDVGMALMNAHAAATLALATIPPPAGEAVAAERLAAGRWNAAAIAAQAFAGLVGQAHGGLDYVPSTGTYVLERGEAVIRRDQGAELGAMISGAKASRDVTVGDVHVSMTFPEITNVEDLYRTDRQRFTDVIAAAISDGVRSGIYSGVEVVNG